MVRRVGLRGNGPDAGARDAWVTPGTYEVAPGVHRIPLPLPGDALRAVNVYALEDGDGVALVDAGWALEDAQRQLDQALGALGHDLGSVRQCLVTHAHRDHYTLAVTLRRLFGTRVRLGRDERDALEEIARPGRKHFSAGLLARIRAAGAPELLEQLARLEQELVPLDPDEWGLPDVWLQDRDEVRVGSRTLRVVATPGHTRGHVVFHDAEAGLLFAGDHVLSQITPSIGFETAPGDSPLGDYLASLELTAALPDTVLLPAHGPVRPSTGARVAELLEHHRVRLEQMQAAVAAGAATALEVARAVGWTRRGSAFGDLDLFNAVIAVNETLAHLDVLVAQARVTVRLEDGTRVYACGDVAATDLPAGIASPRRTTRQERCGTQEW